MASFLITYFLHPFKALRFYGTKRPFWASFLVVALASITASVQALPHSWVEAILVGLFFVFLSTVFLFVAAMVWDFMAQILGAKAQSLTLFAWLGLTVWPLFFLVPLEAIFYVLSLPQFIYQVVNLALSLAVIFLQVNTIRLLYAVSIKKSLVLYFIPVILVFCVVVGLTVFAIALGFAAL